MDCIFRPIHNLETVLRQSPVLQTSKPADQQPEWPDRALADRARAVLAGRPPLVRLSDVLRFRTLLAQVAQGEALVIQAGDCAENPDECTAEHVWRKSALLDLLTAALKLDTGKAVLRVGRIAGQFAKPRSHPLENVAGRELPVYRGHMINSPLPTPDSRRHDPLRLLSAYMTAGDVMAHLGWHGSSAGLQDSVAFDTESAVWTSHEALVLDYELPLTRRLGDRQYLLGSTHWPWIGERTRRLGGAHVELITDVVNPVAVKVGPTMTENEIIALCTRLDPRREPGRLTLISRMGADAVAHRLPPLVRTVARAGHPVIWLCDPMHGNTVTGPHGHKTRLLPTMAHEIREFRRAVASEGGVAGGLHLETTPDEVLECVDDLRALEGATGLRSTLCDPRANPEQAIALVSTWKDTRHAPPTFRRSPKGDTSENAARLRGAASATNS
ncbi:3-deoxy-7-phosphoheptulonate synthase [Streptomyces sp. NPDC047042]|uniref:3-deoxy-7-phosphoheptulonate synthase n=1 Tax=Streptomyces sp. NPDC047042 TaxID=3154807 RepID=UPI0033E1C3E3